MDEEVHEYDVDGMASVRFSLHGCLFMNLQEDQLDKNVQLQMAWDWAVRMEMNNDELYTGLYEEVFLFC